MALALEADLQEEPVPAGPLRDLGIEPRPAGAYIDQVAAG
jgi:hypothetical protein